MFTVAFRSIAINTVLYYPTKGSTKSTPDVGSSMCAVAVRQIVLLPTTAFKVITTAAIATGVVGQRHRCCAVANVAVVV